MLNTLLEDIGFNSFQSYSHNCQFHGLVIMKINKTNENSDGAS